MKKIFTKLLLAVLILGIGVFTIISYVTAVIVVPPTPEISTFSQLYTGTINQSYSQTLQASGGTEPYTWSIITGSLPPGLSLNSSIGTVSGTPTSTGTFNFTVQVTDSNSVSGTKDFVLAIAPQSSGFIYTRTPTGNIVVSPLTIRVQGVFGVDFCTNPRVGSYRIQYSGVVTSARLSAFIPHAQGDVVDDTLQFDLPPDTYTARVLCPSGFEGSFPVDEAFSIPSITISTSNLADGLVGALYSQILQVSGGALPLMWSISSGSLPSGLNLNNSTGEISGTPTTVETTNFTVQVTDANQQSATKDLSIVVHGNTPVGSGIIVAPISGFTLTFTEVVKEGHTTVASSSSGPTPPSGFKLGSPPLYYDISTTAEFTPPVIVCISYDETQFKNEKNLKLLHFENGAWVNVTTSLDTVNNVICGQVSSFSEFALLEDILVDHLIDEVKSFNLKPDIEQGLLDKLTAAKSAIERNQNKTAVNILKAFTNQVKAQKGKALTNEQADILLTDAQALVKFLGGNWLFSLFKFVLFGWLDKLLALISSKP